MFTRSLFLTGTFAFAFTLMMLPVWAQSRSPVDPGAVMQQDFLRYNQPDFYNPSPMRQGNRFKPAKLDPVIITREDIKVKAKLIPSTPAEPTPKFEPMKPETQTPASSPNVLNSGTALPITQKRFIPWQFQRLQPSN